VQVYLVDTAAALHVASQVKATLFQVYYLFFVCLLFVFLTAGDNTLQRAQK